MNIFFMVANFHIVNVCVKIQNCHDLQFATHIQFHSNLTDTDTDTDLEKCCGYKYTFLEQTKN